MIAKAPTLLVLAAGMGSRYGGLKQMDPVGPSGETILDYSVYDALRAGIRKVVFVIRQEMELAFRQQVCVRFRQRIAVEYVFQELDKLPAGFQEPETRTKPWGTTHAILMAKDAIHEPFAVINADDFYGAESFHALAEILGTSQNKTGPDEMARNYAMIGFILRNTLSDFGAVARGLCRLDADGYLATIEELTGIECHGGSIQNRDKEGHITELTGDELVSMNMWGFQPGVFRLLEAEFQRFLSVHGSSLQAECYIPSTIHSLIVAGQARVQVLSSPASWFGVTYREDRPKIVESLQRLIRDGHYPETLWPEKFES
jgi:choline kinase